MRPLTLSLFAQPADDGARLRRRRRAATNAAATATLSFLNKNIFISLKWKFYLFGALPLGLKSRMGIGVIIQYVYNLEIRNRKS